MHSGRNRSTVNMWAKFVLSLVIFAIISNVPSQGTSVAFIMDTTGSMGAEWSSVKKAALKIFETLSQFPIDNVIIVPFNDPGYGPAVESLNTNSFQRYLNGISTDGGGDCDEMCYNGVKIGLEKSMQGSSIYVFTDAPSKNKYLRDGIMTMMQDKSIQINFILTEGCIPKNDKDYEYISERSGGQTITLDESRIDEISKYIKLKIKSGNETIDIVNVSKPSGNFSYTVPVDLTMDSLSVSVSGSDPKIDIRTNLNEIPKNMSTEVDLPKFKSVKVNHPEPVPHRVSVSSTSSHSTKVTGESKVNFNYGFFEDKFEEMTSRPPLNKPVNILIKIIDDLDKIKNLSTVRITNVNGTTLFEKPLINLKDGGSRHIFHSKEDIIFPNEYVYISIIGVDIYNNNFKRTSPTSVKPDVIINKSADVKIKIKPMIKDWNERSFTVETGSDLVIVCDPTGLPKPTVEWTKTNGRPVEGNRLIIPNIQDSDQGEYTCRARNEAGTVDFSANVVTYTKPFFIQAPQNISARLDTTVYLEATFGGTRPITLEWIHFDKPAESEINVSRIDSTDFGRLVVENVKTINGGLYTCRITNKYGSAEQTINFKFKNIGRRH